MSEEIVHNIVGKCKACGEPIDNSIEGYVTNAKGHLFHVKCYRSEVHG